MCGILARKVQKKQEANMLNMKFREANKTLIQEVLQQMGCILLDEWNEVMVEELEEWIKREGDSKESINEFIHHFGEKIYDPYDKNREFQIRIATNFNLWRKCVNRFEDEQEFLSRGVKQNMKLMYDMQVD